ncbi:nucleophile aminohydrolase [Kalaharituber pfeilii]|nr:nucleophile aminohydrolase [Kalaharituber pfeilii]
MNHTPENWGRPRDDIYGFYDRSFLETNPGTAQHTTRPMVTGTSVVALKYNGGVVMAADNLASYGSHARFTDIKRLKQVGTHTVVGAGGDISDMQYLFDKLLESVLIREDYQNDGHTLRAPHIYTYLARVLYNRRCSFNFLWNALLVAGYDDDKKPFLASADLLGTRFSSPALASGFGAHLAIPILRRIAPDEEAAKKLTKEQAIEAIKDCMKVLFYRDGRSLNKYSIAVISEDGVDMQHGVELVNQSWKFAESIKGYGAQTV